MLLLLTTIWFCFMTYLSHQNGEGTTELSVGITEKIIKYFHLTNYYNEIHLLIRQLAHITLFAIFMVLILLTLSQKWQNKKIFIGAILLTVLWTWGDEITKISIPERHFSWRDVLLNLLGVGIGIIIFKSIKYFKLKNKGDL